MRIFAPNPWPRSIAKVGLAILLATSPLTAMAQDSSDSPHDDSSLNRLAESQSPYLQQHATNPVNWFPWSDEAFAKAKEEDKPVLVSIGYSTCHWCHVMNRESFSDPEIAAYLNERFVCIKVDREERPDVDHVYMTFVQQLTGSGGWPLNVWLTPDRKPFFGGTYFPPRARPGIRQIGFDELLKRIHQLWTEKRGELVAQSEQITQTINSAFTMEAEAADPLSWELFSRAIESFSESYDEQRGGFGGAPKFPTPANLSFLLKASVIKELPAEERSRALQMAEGTLQAIARGGIHDHIGGGFHRYSVDAAWQLPHYEKMLYDQALLLSAYVEAWRATGKDLYRQTATKTIAYLLRDMQSPAGGFYSAEDAESYAPENPERKREGAFYLWTANEIREIFADSQVADLAMAHYGMAEEGNAPRGGYHTEELEGFNTLRQEEDAAALAQRFSLSPEQIQEQLATINQTLFEKRASRPRPFLDNKVIVGWNGLTLSALSQASLAFQEPSYAEAAARAADFIRENLFQPSTGELKRLFRDEPSKVDGFGEDYAYLIAGLLDLYEATGSANWLQWAQRLQETHLSKFYDQENGAFFSAVASPEIVFARSKDDYDGAMPSDNSIATKNLARLAQMLDDESYAAKARQTARLLSSRLDQVPTRMPALLNASSFLLKKPSQVVLAYERPAPNNSPLLSTLGQTLLPSAVILHADGASSQDFLAQSLPFIETIHPIDGQLTAYLCENYACQLPTNAPETFQAQLSALLPE